MRIGGISAGSVATAVWTQAVRNLTNLGVIQTAGGNRATLAAGGSVDFRANPNTLRVNTAGISAGIGATGGSQILLYDGTSTLLIATTVSSTLAVVQNIHSTPTQGGLLKNTDASTTSTYMVTGWALLN